MEASNLMAGDVLGSGIFVYGCVYVSNSCSILKGFLKRGIRLLLNLWNVLISLCQTATGINFGLHDHRNKTEERYWCLTGKENPDSLECQVFCRFNGHSCYHVDLQDMH